MHEDRLEELAALELEPSEVRAILVRLGREEFGDGKSTVAAVAEASGRSTAEIGSLLTELRGESFERRFSSVLLDHEGRLAAIEKQLPGTRPSVVKDYSYDAASFQMDRSKRNPRPIDVALAILGAIVGFLVVAFAMGLIR